MATSKDITSNEFVKDIGITIHQGLAGVEGPCVSINNPKIVGGRFEVSNPIFREVKRVDSNGAPRLGDYKTKLNPNGTRYDIWTAAPERNPDGKHIVIDGNITDQLFHGWEPVDPQNENWKNLSYYREGSRVYFDGAIKNVQVWDGTYTGNKNLINNANIDNFPVKTNGYGWVIGHHGGVIFRLPPEFTPKKNFGFTVQLHYEIPTSYGGTQKYFGFGELIVNRYNRYVSLIRIFSPDGSALVNKSVRIVWLYVQNVNYCLF